MNSNERKAYASGVVGSGSLGVVFAVLCGVAWDSGCATGETTAKLGVIAGLFFVASIGLFAMGRSR